MPQRTRVPMTGDAAPTPSAAPKRAKRERNTVSDAPPASAAASDRDGGSELVLAGLSREELARALRAMAAELDRDPSLARRVSEAMRDLDLRPTTLPPTDEKARAAASNTEPAVDAPRKHASRTFRPRVVAGAAPELGTGIPDPFALRARLGEAGLRRVLVELRLGTLRAIVREHGLDPTGTAVRGNDAERLRALILQRTSSRRD